LILNEKIVIIGATSSIAEHCARLWVTNAAKELILIGRDGAGLQRIVMDLSVRNPSVHIETKAMDLLDASMIKSTVNEVCSQGAPDIVLIAHGSLPEQSKCQHDASLVAQTLAVNGSSPAVWAESFAEKFESGGQGTIAVIGSVAGDRARKSNYVYGSAKAMVASYVEGLQHRFAGTNVHAVLIKPGPTDTPMTQNMKGGSLKLAPVSAVAKVIVKGIERKKTTIYVPGKWWLIMRVIKCIPQFIFNKMDI
jgi:decaprenylphospho-beta-D-erythro-pentofuranosid-2-ulose 2-reductase